MRGADYFIKRFLFAVVTVFVAITLNFALFRLAPGTAVSNLSRVPPATPEPRRDLVREPAAGLVQSDDCAEEHDPDGPPGDALRDHPRHAHGRHLGLAPRDR